LNAYNLLKTASFSKKESETKRMAAPPHPDKPSTEKQSLWIIDLGRQGYEETWGLQKRLVRARQEDRVPDVLLLLEHEPVFTLGRRGRKENMLLGEEALKARGMTLIATERGGDVTYHGPGQLVGYPVVRVPGEGRKVKALVRDFEEVLLRTLTRFGVEGKRDPRNPGVWVGEAKIGSVGIAVQHGVSFHGFSLNANMDLSPFSWIHTCGHRDLSVTSLAERLGDEVSVREVKEAVASLFVETLSYRVCMPDATRYREVSTLGLPSPGARFMEG
jgi:lipoate-protein ligase B